MTNKAPLDWNHPFFYHLTGAIEEEDSKHWITPTVAVGGLSSSYECFNVVVNANYPYNHIKQGKITRREENFDNSRCTLYLLGMCDHDQEHLDNYLDLIIPRLSDEFKERPSTRFLFHCYAGKSRSVVLAAAFLVEVMGMELDAALALIQEKRWFVAPRPSFVETLRKRYEKKTLDNGS